MLDRKPNTIVELFVDQPTVFHITHWKAGSQWVYGVLDALAPQRIILPQPQQSHFRAQPIIAGAIYPTVYVTRDDFEQVETPPNSRTFFVMRDLRDTLISWYFSTKVSHPEMHLPRDRQRGALLQRTIEEGLYLGMHTNLEISARIQRSWINREDTLVVKYEDLLKDEFHYFKQIIEYCQFDASEQHIRNVVKAFSFKNRTKRNKGQEDKKSHLRKGVAGDWKTYLTGDLLAEFKEYFDQTLIETGYEQDRDWGLDALPTTISVGPIERLKEVATTPDTCFCGSDSLEEFNPDYLRCQQCHSLICKHKLSLDNIVVKDDNKDLYGKRYWEEPRYFGRKGTLQENAQKSLIHAPNLRILSELTKYFEPHLDTTILDIGAGSGALGSLLSQAGYSVTALELSPHVVQFIQSEFQLMAHVGPVERQTFEEKSFDVILLVDVAEHFPDPVSTLSFVLRLLKDDGVLLLRSVTISLEQTYEELYWSGSKQITSLKPVLHQSVFTRHGIETLLKNTGYEWVEFTSGVDWIAGRDERPKLPEQPRFALTSQKMVMALIDLNSDLERAYKRRDADRELAFKQLTRIRAGSVLSIALFRVAYRFIKRAFS